MQQGTTATAQDPTTPKLVDAWRQAQHEDPLLLAIINTISGTKGDNNHQHEAWAIKRAQQFTMRGGLLYWVDVTGPRNRQRTNLAIAVPATFVKGVLHKVHSTPAIGAHMGVQKLYPVLKSSFWWPGMFRDLEKFTQGCVVCQANQAPNRTLAPVGMNITATKRMEVLSIDALALPSVLGSTRYCLTVVDHVTRFAWAIVVPDIQAATVLHALKEHVCCVFGWPDVLLSDNGTEFKNNTLAEICELVGTERRFTTAYHPQTNGLTERMNRTIMALLRKTIEDNDDWPTKLPDVLMAYNNTPLVDAQSPSDTPFVLMFGRQYPLPAAAELGASMSEITPEDVLKSINDVVKAREERLATQKAKANENRRPLPHFQIGQIVWKQDNAIVSNASHNRQDKLAPKWIGLFVVIRQPSASVAVVRALGGEITQSVNTSQLMAYTTDTKAVVLMHADQVHRDLEEKEDLAATATTPEVTTTTTPLRRSTRTKRRRQTDPDVCDVRAVIDHQIDDDGTVSFKIDWMVEGTEVGWEPEENLNCPFLVREYFKSKAPVRASQVQDE
jgi:transposase InsO family protein